jgi:hypothetical protein
MSATAENVHSYRAHAYTRIARLTREGVLSKLTVLVDPIKGGPGVLGLRDPEAEAGCLARTA